MYTVCFYNKKGGVGKTSITGAIGSYLSYLGYKVLMIDSDIQGNLSSQFLKNVDTELADYLSNNNSDENEIEKVIYSTGYQNLYIIPTNALNTKLQNWVTSESIKTENADVFEYLKADAKCYDFDFILYDMPPTSSEMHKKILLSSDEVVPILQIAQSSIAGLSAFIPELQDLKRRKSKPIFERLVFNMQDKRKTVQKALMPVIEELTNLTKYFLPNDESFRKAELQGCSIFDIPGVKKETLEELNSLSNDLIKNSKKE